MLAILFTANPARSREHGRPSFERRPVAGQMRATQISKRMALGRAPAMPPSRCPDRRPDARRVCIGFTPACPSMPQHGRSCLWLDQLRGAARTLTPLTCAVMDAETKHEKERSPHSPTSIIPTRKRGGATRSSPGFTSAHGWQSSRDKPSRSWDRSKTTFPDLVFHQVSVSLPSLRRCPGVIVTSVRGGIDVGRTSTASAGSAGAVEPSRPAGKSRARELRHANAILREASA